MVNGEWLIGIDALTGSCGRGGRGRSAIRWRLSGICWRCRAAHRWRLYVDAVPPDGAVSGSGDNVELCLLPARRMWTHRALSREVARRPPDVLFVPAHVLPFRVKLPPSVVTVHDLGYRHVPEGHTRRQRLYPRTEHALERVARAAGDRRERIDGKGFAATLTARAPAKSTSSTKRLLSRPPG